MALLGNLIKRSSSIRSKMELRKQTSIQIQQKTLRHLLRKSAKTAFGKHYCFEQILKTKNFSPLFQKYVPIHDYNKIHDEWWHRSLKGEEDIAWRGKTKYFALSSGTSGAPSKYLPITGRPPAWIRRMCQPGDDIKRIKNWDDRIDAIIKQAPNWDIGFLMGIPSWNQLMLEKIIDYHKLDNIHQIWPNLSMFIHGGIAFDPYKKGFESLLAKPLQYLDTYLASEGFLAYQNRPNAGMKLVLDNGIFFEFIPFNSENFDEHGEPFPNAEALDISQVEEGKEYAILISTNAGAWRYLLGDTIRFTDLERAEILITGRTKHFLSVCGEHLSVENMNHAIQKVEEDLKISIREFTVSYLPDGNSFKHRWYVGCESNVDQKILQKALDYHLRQLNDDYATERNSLLGLEVVPLSISHFYQWLEEKGKMGGQSKFPRVMKPKLFAEWETFISK